MRGSVIEINNRAPIPFPFSLQFATIHTALTTVHTALTTVHTALTQLFSQLTQLFSQLTQLFSQHCILTPPPPALSSYPLEGLLNQMLLPVPAASCCTGWVAHWMGRSLGGSLTGWVAHWMGRSLDGSLTGWRTGRLLIYRMLCEFVFVSGFFFSAGQQELQLTYY